MLRTILRWTTGLVTLLAGALMLIGLQAGNMDQARAGLGGFVIFVMCFLLLFVKRAI